MRRSRKWAFCNGKLFNKKTRTRIPEEQLQLPRSNESGRRSKSYSAPSDSMFGEAEVWTPMSRRATLTQMLQLMRTTSICLPIRANVDVHRYCQCTECIRPASMPAQPIPGSQASPPLLANVMERRHSGAATETSTVIAII